MNPVRSKKPAVSADLLKHIGLLTGLLFVSPFFALAQQPYTRYCPDPTQIFTGVATNRDGSPKIELEVDPAFNEKMTRERFTSDLPVAPIYDLVFTVVPTINEYCLPQYDENGTLIKKVDPPKTLPFTASIELAGKALISASSLLWNGEKDNTGLPIYEWKIAGWPNGIVSESKMERLIRAVHDGNPSLMLAVQVKLAGGRRERIDKSAEFALCVPVWGNGPHGIVYDRVAHRLSDFTYQANSIISGAFLKVDPFKAYQKSFSHIFNLRNYKGKGWTSILDLAKSGKLPLVANCGTAGTHITISPLVETAYVAAALSGEHLVQIASDVTRRLQDPPFSTSIRSPVPLPFPLITLHEIGHAFAGLKDEYVRLQGFPIGDKNCDSGPGTNWNLDSLNFHYGDRNIKGCTDSESYRPSQASIMRGAQSGETRFNVVSCGYIVAAIKGGEGPKYWPECMNPQWNTIKPTGKTALFGLNLASIFQSFAFTPSSASVSDSTNSKQDIYIEYMSADGTITGEVISVPSVSYVSPPLADLDNSGDEDTDAVPPPVSNISDVGDESIFDTLSVDLKVNGQDGPVEVEKRERIVLSWISEGATRCRGVWSKNDIKLSGTAAGRITRPVTIKIACINADGERADDEVRVTVTD